MITILRLGHRPNRDLRVTTHLGLVARAFGASRLVLTVPDEQVQESISDVNSRFGGDFEIDVIEDWRAFLREWKGLTVHLTMYGIHVDDCIDEISAQKDILVVVGAQKVPRGVFEEADFNIAIGHQPHSEIAAVTLFLDRYLRGAGLKTTFDGPMEILPSEKGKNVQMSQEKSSSSG